MSENENRFDDKKALNLIRTYENELNDNVELSCKKAYEKLKD